MDTRRKHFILDTVLRISLTNQLGFIPPEPISPEKALKLLRYMNTSLAIRLNVHENLPRHLKKWRIESGRATFVVDNEFELDVMSFTEDASEQWHFIDLRLLFSPAPSISVDSRFQGHFKPQVDYILKQSGLSGAYDFLHGFILTHKIAILKSQAYQLARAAWAGTIKVEPVHRSLVVQYWTDRPGRKSWIEIGVTSNKPKNGKISWRGAPISALTVRWFRHGIEVKNVDLKFDFANLSMERMLMKVISLHIGHFLKIGLAALPAKMTAKASFSETEPCDCTLEVSLGRPENKTTLSLEHVTGRYILRPCTSISARAEQAINQAKDPLAAISPTITQLLAQTLQDLIQRNALQLGWQPQPRHSLRSDIVKQATKLDILQYTLYWPSGWSMKWALAAVIDASGESWWLMELGGKGTRIEYAEPLSVERPGPAPAISRAMLASTERLAVQQLAFCVTRRDLEKHTIPSSVRSELSLRSSPSNMATQVALRGWVLHLRTSDLLVAKPGEEPWLNPTIWVTYQGFKADYRNVSHIASGTMVKAVAADMQKLMSASPQSNFTFSENGNFAILLTSPFGEPIIDELKARLRDVDRLRSFTTTLQKRKMKLKSSSLQQVQFQYGRNHTATVNFGQENDIQVTFGATNAHNRIRTFLAEIINDKTPFCLPGADKNGLDRFCSTLLFTRPLLSTFTELENSVPGNLRNPAVRAHHVGYYRVTYANPLCSFDIQLRPKEDKVFWHIEDNDRKQPDSRPNSERNPNHKRIESLKTALTTLFKGQGQGWLGIRSGILAEIDGVPDALKTLHQIVMSCHVEGGAPPVLENSSQVPATNSTGPASTNINPAAAPSNNTTRLAPPNSTTRPAPPNARPNFPNAGKQMKTGVKKQEVIELD